MVLLTRAATAVQSSAPSFVPVFTRAHIRRPINTGQMAKKTAAGMYTRCALLASGSNASAVSVPAMPKGRAPGSPRALLAVDLGFFPPRRARAAYMSASREALLRLSPDIEGGRKILGRRTRVTVLSEERRTEGQEPQHCSTVPT